MIRYNDKKIFDTTIFDNMIVSQFLFKHNIYMILASIEVSL